MRDESTFVRHCPCESCGSSDANALYSDGHTFCHKCFAYVPSAGNVPASTTKPVNSKLIEGLTYSDLPARCLTEKTCQVWGYGTARYKNKPVQVASYFSPDGKLVAQKLRDKDKNFVILGNIKAAGLYGQHLWRDGGRMVVITEGEIDAMSVSQVQNHKWPVVSVPNGAKSAKKAIAAQLEWLEKFETVVLMFDMDDDGRAAVAECAELFEPGKCKVARLPLKDANDMLKAGRGSEIIDAIWGAKEHRPDGIINGADPVVWQLLTEEDHTESKPYPWSGLQSMTRGQRRGEVVTWCAGTGIGKSAIVGEIAYDLLINQDETIGYIALEESVRRTSQRLVGLHLNKPLHISPESVTQDQLREAYQATLGTGRLYLYDHWGSLDSENLLSKIRYLARGCGCTTIILDHISIVVSGLQVEDGDERRIIDNLMTNIRKLVEETRIRLHLVSHLKRPDGKPHEEGAQTSLAQLRGSHAIGQLSDIVVGIERNQQDKEHPNLSTVRVLKNRFSGETGIATYLTYDPETGRLHETHPAFEAADDERQVTAF